MTSKSRGHCDNIKVFNQGKSNQSREKSGNLIAKNVWPPCKKKFVSLNVCQLLNLVFSIFNAVSDQFSASKWFIYEKTDTGKQFSSKTSLTTLDFYSVEFLILLTIFFKRILPLHVCSIFTGFLLTKSLFCTSISFFKSCKNRGRSFCRPQGFAGRLKTLKGDCFAPVAL